MRTTAPGAGTLAERSDRTAADAVAADAALAASGDASAFERLYRGHVARIHTLARRMLGADEADEATQDTFVRAWEKLGSFRGDASFGTWLYRLGINVMLGRRAVRSREARRMHADEAAIERIAPRAPAPEDRMDFEAAMERLPEGARTVFVLHDVEGFKHHEIAEMLGVTAGTSKAQLHRARMVLRRHLER